MDYSYIFRSAKIKEDTLESAGFVSGDGKSHTLRASILNGDFYAAISLNTADQTINVQLFDSETNEKYALFDMPNAHGAFVASLRNEVQQVINGIKERCFEIHDLKDDYIAYLRSHFHAEPDFPWEDSPDAFVVRCENNKWFALVMKIKYRQLGLTGDEGVWVVNLKASPDEIPGLIDRKSIFPAWHMNKKHWITVILTAATDFERLCELTQKSYSLII